MIKYLKSRTMAFTLISFLISLVLAGIIIAAAGYSPVEAYSAMLGGAFGSTYNLAQTAGTAIPLIFAGLAMAVASKAGIFNIGIEGQILAGACLLPWQALISRDCPPSCTYLYVFWWLPSSAAYGPCWRL